MVEKADNSSNVMMYEAKEGDEAEFRQIVIEPTVLEECTLIASRLNNILHFFTTWYLWEDEL